MIICYGYRATHSNSNTLDRTRRVNTDERPDGHQSSSDRKTGTAEVGARGKKWRRRGCAGGEKSSCSERLARTAPAARRRAARGGRARPRRQKQRNNSPCPMKRELFTAHAPHALKPLFTPTVELLRIAKRLAKICNNNQLCIYSAFEM